MFTKRGESVKIISYEEFQRLDLRVGKVLAAEKIPGKTKILKLKIDVGTETIETIAGGAEFYPPEFFKGRTVIVLVNLEPKKIAGVESKGMVLAADVGGKPIWLSLEGGAPPGTIVK
jgi:methionine--tRNA ligase beta chain